MHLADAVPATQRSEGVLNGIKGIWPFERLQYANITTQFSRPMEDSCCGCIVLLLEIICAKYTASNSSKKTISISKDDNELTDGDGDPIDRTMFEYCPYHRPKYTKSNAPYSAATMKCAAGYAAYCYLLGLQRTPRILTFRPLDH